MAERDPDPGGGGGVGRGGSGRERGGRGGGGRGGGKRDNPQTSQLSLNEELRSDQGGELGAQSPHVGSVSVPGVSVKDVGDLKDCKDDSHASHHSASQQAVPKSRTITRSKVYVYADPPLDEEKDIDVLMPQDSTPSSKGPNKKTKKKKRNKKNRKKREEAQKSAQHESDSMPHATADLVHLDDSHSVGQDSKPSLEPQGDEPSVEATNPTRNGNNGMEDNPSKQTAEQEKSHHATASSEPLETGKRHSTSDTVLNRKADPVDSHGDGQDSKQLLDPCKESSTPHPSDKRNETGGPVQPEKPPGGLQRKEEKQREIKGNAAAMSTDVRVFGKGRSKAEIPHPTPRTLGAAEIPHPTPRTHGAAEIDQSSRLGYGNGNDASSSTERRQGGQSDKLNVSSRVSSNQGPGEGKPCEAMKVILHAFIEPAHWGRSYDSLIVEVRSDLSWDKAGVGVDTRLIRFGEGPAVAVESTLTLPQTVKFPFEYKYYVHVSSKAKDCYEHLSHHESSARVNRCIRSKPGLLQGLEAHAFHQYDDFIVPSPRSSVWSKFKSLVGFGSGNAASERNEQLLNHSLQLHLERMSDLLSKFISGKEEADQLIEHIVLVCKHVNDHCVVANPDQGKTKLAICGQADVQKIVVQWILKVAKAMTEGTQLSQHSVSEVVKLQATGLVAIAVTEAVLPEGAYPKLTSAEVGEVAKLLSYHSMPLIRIVECQELVCKYFSTRKSKDTIRFSLENFIRLLAEKENITMILDALLFLLSWSGSLDSKRNFAEHHSIIRPLQCAFSSVLGRNPAECKHGWLAMSISDPHLLKHRSFSEFVLQIIPPKYWESIASYTPLQTLFEYLNKFLFQSKIEDQEALRSLIQCVQRILQKSKADSHMQPVSAGRNVNEILAIHGWNITECIMRWQGHLDVKSAAVSLYLDVCDFDAARGSNFGSSKFLVLVDHVVTAIQYTFQHRGVSTRDPRTFKFGCADPNLLGQEMALWARFTTQECSTRVHNKWLEVCGEKLSARLLKVQFELQMQTFGFCQSHDANIPDMLARSILNTAVATFSTLKESEQEKYLKKKNQDSTVHGFFSEVLNKQYRNPSNIGLHDLCNWKLWPCFFKLSQTCDILQDSETFSVAAALLQSTSEAISKGEIAVQEIRVLTGDVCSQRNFEEILSTLQVNVHAEAIVQNLQSAKDHLQRFEHERSQVLILAKRLQGHCQAEAKRDIQVIYDHCQKIVEKVEIQQLLDFLWSFPHSTEFRSICNDFAILFSDLHSSGIVVKVWDDICPRVLTNLAALSVEVWPAFRLQLHKVAINLITFNISCEDAASLLDSRLVVSELHCLQHTLHDCRILEPLDVFEPLKVQERLLLFEDIKGVEEEAESLLKFKESLGLTGDFDSVVIISQCATALCQQPLLCLDDSLRRVVDFLKQLSSDRLAILQACLFGMRDSRELMQWLKDEVKDVVQLQTFTNMALISHCENATTADSVKYLEAVGTKMAPFIYHLRDTAGVKEFIECCSTVRMDSLADVPKLLVSCQQSLELYKSIEKMLGSIEKTTFGQIQDLTNDGEYSIAAPKGKIPTAIAELVTVEIQKGRNSQSVKTTYSLDDLRDLQSKLALIRGNITDDKIEKMAAAFWQGLELTVRIADTLLDLLVVGHANYSRFQQKYFKLAERNTLCMMERDAKALELDLEKWNVEVEDLRSEFYELNYFTSRQLSLICQQLSISSPDMSLIQPWFKNLLLSICPSMAEELVLQAASCVAAKKDRAGEQLLLGLDHHEDEQEKDHHKAASTEGTVSGTLPSLTEDELDEKEKAIFDLLCIEMEFSDSFVLRGLTEQGPDLDAVWEYCLQSGVPECSATAAADLDLEDTAGQRSITVSHTEHPLISRLTDQGFEIELVKEAIEACGDDEDEVTHYCFENENTFVPKSENVLDTFGPSSSLRPLPVSNKMPVCIQTSSEGLWELKEVGQFLRFVFQYHQDEGQYQFMDAGREFSSMFEDGSPNLLVVPRGDLYRTVLSVYRDSEALPLPTKEEVLLCNSTTTAEDIRLLWRRAMHDPGHKRIFCLVCEHNLSYKVAKEAVQSLRKISQGCIDFKVVIICCREDEASSLLVSDMREFKRNPYPQSEEADIRYYLRKHFLEDADHVCHNVKCVGASVDPQRSCVRVVASSRSGMGKTLYIRHRVSDLEEACSACEGIHKIVTLHGPDVSNDIVVKALLAMDDNSSLPIIQHLDVSERVIDDIGSVLFSMLILRGLQDSEGNVWRCNLKNLSVVEVTLPEPSENKPVGNSVDLLRLLPMVNCLSPVECLNSQPLADTEMPLVIPVGMDNAQLRSDPYQRVYLYLSRYKQEESVDKTIYPRDSLNEYGLKWIQLILSLFQLPDPSWRELCHFIQFLNVQLEACEHSVYCDEALAADPNMGVSGFKTFVVKFMITMSVDFTIPSLKFEVDSHSTRQTCDPHESMSVDLEGYQIAASRSWESNVHPYIFFNRDWNYKEEVHYDSMTFVGFNFQQMGKAVQLWDLSLTNVIDDNIMSDGLYRWLKLSGVETRQDPNKWSKLDILKKLYRVMESNVLREPDDFYFNLIDPDSSYALTYDNMVKMLAIQMRFRCGIPVVIMGETGCGKTRLVRYMCQLQARLKMDPENLDATPSQTFFILKVHGGITEHDIINFIDKVQKIAVENQKQNLETVVFFDEANTTDAIGLIKEIMCDHRMRGAPIKEDIKFIAACNPYRKHSDDMIERLESAGLGFFILATETKQKLGDTPLRQLVYRVLDLPTNMRPLVYDYGGLGTDTEGVYIQRMIENHQTVQDSVLGLTHAITSMLSWCQGYMRQRTDECSYVSLRDIERFMIVYKWFQGMHQELSERMLWDDNAPDACTMAMILALAVCYCSRLIDHGEFEEQVVQRFLPPFELPEGVRTFRRTIFSCQEAFLSSMVLGPNIARNAALRENVFMMAVCVELRIPLFVVGKPGSSKSLAKSIIAESMKGQNSKNEFLKKLTSVKLLTYQCSQLSTPESITDVFKTAKYLQSTDTSQGLSLVVLDEVGLAEDSPSFPLKALHPLLEDGTDGLGTEDKIVPREERVAFIGISNWALDPAKMNRGIMVMRGVPGNEELVNSARGICSTEEDDPVREVLEPFLKELAKGYADIVSEQEGSRKEFFGLRDFYSLIKMLYWLIKNSGTPYHLSDEQLKHAILRNFGGSKQIHPLEMFAACFSNKTLVKSDQSMDCSPFGLIQASLQSKDISWHGENRYLLFLTENDAALEIMQNYLLRSDVKPPYVLFGSSFPRDKDYTQVQCLLEFLKVCRNINQIKICMETGRTVVLLNLENLYESLYDLLNQYYTVLRNNRYVDLGLQTHRIICRVHDDFKLILIADIDKVYEKFPIPLINRLEKHIVTTSTILRPEQKEVLQELRDWLKFFCTMTSQSTFKDGDAFIGYQSETAAAVVLHASQLVFSGPKSTLETCKELMIQMACPDALARLKDTKLHNEADEIWDLYFRQQEHLSLSRLLLRQLEAIPAVSDSMGMLIQVTTHSQPLAPVDVSRLCLELKIERQTLMHFYIEELDTEAEYTDRIRKHMSTVVERDIYILVQCSSGHLNKDLISCARHKAIDELENFRGKEEWTVNYHERNRRIHVIFIVSLPKSPGGTKFDAFQGGRWLCVHLDDLRSPESTALTFMAAVQFPLSKLFSGLGGITLYKRLPICLQAAIAQIPEVTQSKSHKTDILHTLLKVISGDGGIARSDDNNFYSALVRKITPLVKELEQSQTDVLGKNWAVTEALDPHRLQEGGTFLNTLLRKVDGILTDLLANIIEFTDLHDNLALLNDDRLQGLWLDIFQDDNICAFSYKSLHQQAEKSTTTSLVHKLGSVTVGEYTCKMPFSWIVLEAVEAQWTQTTLESDSDECRSLISLFEKMEVQCTGPFLREYPMEAASHLELDLLYLKDFVAGVLQAHNVEEAKVLETTVVLLSDQMLESIEEVTLLHRLLSYHVAYHLNEVHFEQYRALGDIFEDLHGLVQKELSLQDQAETPPQPISVREEPLDLLAVKLLLDRISPKPVKEPYKTEFWNVQNLRHVYIKKLRECQATVDGILKFSSSSLREKWQSIRAVQMYIEHLLLPLPVNEKIHEEIRKGAFRMWSRLTMLGKSTTFSRKEQLEHFMSILRHVDDCVAAHFGCSAAEDRRGAVQVTSDSPGSEGYGDFCKAVKMLFLEVVSVLCFGQGSYEPPTPELIEVLMQRVFQSDQVTQDLTPLNWEENDSNPVIRSVLLQLILMGSKLEVDPIIKGFITTCSRYVPGESEPNFLYSLVIRCLEDTAYKTWHMTQDRRNFAQSVERLGDLLDSSIHSYAQHISNAQESFKWLNTIAQLRLALALTADYLCTYVADTPEKRALKHRDRMMMDQFVDLLSGCLQRPELQDLSLYLAKQIARRHGMVILKQLYNQGCVFVLPPSLQQSQMQPRVPDMLALSGDGYGEIREAVVQALVDESDQSVKEMLNHLPAECAQCIPLVLFAKLTWPTQHSLRITDRLLDSIASSIQQCGVLNTELTDLTLSLLRRDYAGVSSHMQPTLDPGARLLTALVLHVVVAVFSRQSDPLLQPFVSILNHPATLHGKYLPTMPDDFLVEVMTLMDMQGQYQSRADMRGKFFRCPNGHPYIITECTGPNQGWNCPVCGKHIGAQNSQLAEGNAAVPMANRFELGYILGDARSRSNEAIPERNLSPLSCAVMRFILHACFMWSACHQPEAVSQSIVAVEVGDVATFFWEHLLLDVKVLGKALSSAEDEVSLYLHQVITSITARTDVTVIMDTVEGSVHPFFSNIIWRATSNRYFTVLPTTDCPCVDGSLASKSIRDNWEDYFCRHILDPMLQNPAVVIQNGLDVILHDAELDRDELFLAVYEKTAREPDMMQTLWSFRTRITLQGLTAALNTVPDVKREYPLLHKFLQEEPLLRALQYLPNIVQLQKVLVACLNHKVDRSEAHAVPIGKYFGRITNSEEERASLVECLAGFKKAWELVKERLVHHRIRISAADVQDMGDISEDQPVVYFLPCASGPGLCALALSDFLLFQQNELIEHCDGTLPKFACSKRKSIPLAQVQPFHMVSYEGEIDSVILTHCRYSLTYGKGQEVEYDFAALAKHIYDRFLVTKPKVDGTSQSLMVYTSDIIRQDVFQQLRDKIKPQIVLSPEEQREVLDTLHNDLRHVTEALSIVTTAMAFLASAGSRPDVQSTLKDYILKVLKIRRTAFCANCTLQHVLSLWETLALAKARMHSLNGKKIPFDGYNDATKELFQPMPKEAEEAYRRSLKGIPLESLMSLQFQFIQIRLRTFVQQDFQWPLKDCLLAYIPDCNDNNVQDLEERLEDLPEGISVKHAVHVWNITVRHHNNILQSASVHY